MNKNKKESKIKEIVYRMYEKHDYKDPLSLTFDLFYIFILLVGIVITFLEISPLWEQITFLRYIEYVIFLFLAIEWLATFYVYDYTHPQLSFWKAKLKWFISLESILDLVCLAVFILSLVEIKGLNPEFDFAFGLIALLKLVRLYKFNKYPMFHPVKSKQRRAEIDKKEKEKAEKANIEKEE